MLRNRSYLAYVFCFVFSFFCSNVFGVPLLINYQGKLTDSAGAPVPDTSPIALITFRIYDTDGVTAPGTCLWGEEQANVTTKSGVFNVLLGNGTTATGCTGSLKDALDGSNRWLEIQVSGDLAMVPRQLISSVGYAITAAKLENTVHVSNGNVGVGTMSPGEKLTVAGTIESTSGGIKFPDGTTQATAGLRPFVGATTAKYTGSQVGGYDAGDAKCSAQFGAGARMCSTADFALGRPTETTPGWYNTFGQFLFLLPSTPVETADCRGWSDDQYNVWGASAQNGIFTSNRCSNAESIHCCK